jgi:hypothetical protein
MHNKILFEYAIIRLVPKVEREEFMNIGVITLCTSLKEVRVLYHLNEERIKLFAPELDLEEIKKHVASLASIGSGTPNSGPIGKLDAPSRFRWLTAIRSTVIQSSRIHPGMCSGSFEETTQKLFTQFVL